jgi:hypothetical protein
VAKGEPKPTDYLEVDHADRDKRNNALANLRPACRDCNRNSGPDNGRYLPSGTPWVQDQHGYRLRAVGLVCAWCKVGFLVAISDARRGRRFCTHTCAMLHRNRLTV